MDNLLDNDTAVVTGAASGIGRAIATTFATAGADVVVADIRQEPREGGQPTHERIAEETDADAVYVECDVTDPDALATAIDAADEFGGLDIMVNNAGVVGPMAPITEIDLEAYQELLAINLDSVFIGSQRAAERLIEQGRGGSIVNMSSITALHGYGGLAAYCTAKGGIRSLTHSLADELGPHGIRVNAILPGQVETAMITEDMRISFEQAEAIKEQIPLRKLAQPTDIANAALFLASDMASHITAESLLVDGGIRNTG